MEAIKLTTKQAAPIVKLAFPDYTGRKFKLEFTPKVYFYDTNWSGGTRNYYSFVRSDGNKASLPSFSPWMNPVEGKSIEIPPDILVVIHQYFCGSDLGIRILSNPVNAPKWLEG